MLSYDRMKNNLCVFFSSDESGEEEKEGGKIAFNDRAAVKARRPWMSA